MNEQRNNGRGIFYGVIGVATLVVAIIGATFAYFTATASNDIMTGNMATVSLGLSVIKVTEADVTKGGMIPMSNSMVEQAVNKGYTETVADGEGTKQVTNICIDDNGNAVCQIYKITITNTSSASQFVDGYVALRGGSGVEPTDLPEGVTYVPGAKVGVNAGAVAEGVPANGTTMRWAQVFETSATDDNKFTTAGDQILGTASEKVSLTAIGNNGTGEAAAKNLVNIRTENSAMLPAASNDANNNGLCDANESGCTTGEANPKGVLTSATIAGTPYAVIGANYIRISNHAWKADGTAEAYRRETDITSALVFNHSIPAGQARDYYVVVWLSETGTNQTAGATVGADLTNPGATGFFLGNVTFVSAQGSEVSATFSGYSRVQAVVESPAE